MAKLTEDDVREIRRLRSEGYLLRELAAKYGVVVTCIGMICNRKTWRHVE